ncbi:hypothetical protein GCM10028794_19850 [Silanimonas algicola]
MTERTVILHGWSDEAGSFRALAGLLTSDANLRPVVIDLADWASMDDHVTYADLAEAMHRAWRHHGLPTAPRATNLIVHSTGALVAREWMTRFFSSQSVPVKRLVMLAPANFGSSLAHKGRSFIGRAIKGWANGFETGTQILKGLELASPYTRALADKDLFAEEAWYGAGKVLATVVIGDHGYDGVRQIANEEGSDGTVRISTANLNCARLRVALDENQSPTGAVVVEPSRGEIAFAIAPGHNHSSICLGKAKSEGSKEALARLIVRALQVTDADYVPAGASFPWQGACTALLGTPPGDQAFQNTVTHVRDHLGNAVHDYFMEFYRRSGKDDAFEREIYDKVIRDVHAYGDDPSRRSLHLDVMALDTLRQQKRMAIDALFISVTAHPIYQRIKGRWPKVGYKPLPENGAGGIRVPGDQLERFFAKHRTLFVDLTLQRSIADDLFKLERVATP